METIEFEGRILEIKPETSGCDGCSFLERGCTRSTALSDAIHAKGHKSCSTDRCIYVDKGPIIAMERETTAISTDRPHADLIRAWAGGAEIQFWCTLNRSWLDVTAPSWDSVIRYRLSRPKIKKYKIITKAHSHGFRVSEAYYKSIEEYIAEIGTERDRVIGLDLTTETLFSDTSEV